MSKTLVEPPYGYTMQIAYKKPKSFHPTVESKQTTTLIYNDAGGWICEPGSQGSFGPGINTRLCNPTHLLDLFSQGAKFNTGSVQTIIQSSGLQHNKFLLMSAKQTITFTNQSPSSTEVDVYLVQCRETQAQNGTSPAYVSPETMWTQGLTGSNSISQDTIAKELRSSPTVSKTFNFGWRVVKKLLYKLDPGGEAKFTYSFKPNRYIDTGYINPTNNVRLALNGISHDFIFVSRGVAGDTAQTRAVGTVTTTASKVVYSSNIVYQAKMCTEYPKIVRTMSNIQTVTFGTGALYTIGDASGTVVNNNVDTSFA